MAISDFFFFLPKFEILWKSLRNRAVAVNVQSGPETVRYLAALPQPSPSPSPSRLSHPALSTRALGLKKNIVVFRYPDLPYFFGPTLKFLGIFFWKNVVLGPKFGHISVKCTKFTK